MVNGSPLLGKTGTRSLLVSWSPFLVAFLAPSPLVSKSPPRSRFCKDPCPHAAVSDLNIHSHFLTLDELVFVPFELDPFASPVSSGTSPTIPKVIGHLLFVSEPRPPFPTTASFSTFHHQESPFDSPSAATLCIASPSHFPV